MPEPEPTNYVPADQATFDEMRTAIEQAVLPEHRHLIAQSYLGVSGYDPKDLAEAMQVAGPPPADAPKFADRLVEILGPEWIERHEQMTAAHDARVAAAPAAEAPVRQPLWPGRKPGKPPSANRTQPQAVGGQAMPSMGSAPMVRKP